MGTALVCDGDNDCGDATDELPEICSKSFNQMIIRWKSKLIFKPKDNNKCDESSEFRCDSGRCITKTARCDRQKHCRDGSDERGCGNPLPLLINCWFTLIILSLIKTTLPVLKTRSPALTTAPVLQWKRSATELSTVKTVSIGSENRTHLFWPLFCNLKDWHLMRNTRTPVPETWPVLHMRSNVLTPMSALFPIGCNNQWKGFWKKTINVCFWTTGAMERMTVETTPTKTQTIARTSTVLKTGSVALTTGMASEVKTIVLIMIYSSDVFQWRPSVTVLSTVKTGWLQMSATRLPVRVTWPVLTTSSAAKRPISAHILIGYDLYVVLRPV